MKKIIFAFAFSVLIIEAYSQCTYVTNQNLLRLNVCTLNVVNGPVTITPTANFGSNVSVAGTITAGTWNGGIISPTYGGTGYSSFPAALSAYGVAASGSAITWPDTLSKIMTFALAATTYQTKFTGLSSQYVNGTGSLTSFPTNLSAFSNGPGYINDTSSLTQKSFASFTYLKKTDTTGKWLRAGAPVVLTSGSYSNPSWINSLAQSKISYSGSTSQYVRGDGTYAALNTDNVPEGSNLYFTSSRARSSFSQGTGISISSGVITNSAPDQTVVITGSNGTKVTSTYPSFTITDPVYTNSGSVSGGSGQVVFYLTSDKTSTGTALYSTVDAVIPIVNDATQNYTYGWSYNSTTKALTITTRVSSGIYVSLLNLTLLGAPTVAANGTTVYVAVKGN